ncbi:MAG: restriction endonuclease subunit S [Rubrobacter sp.]|nr:restriction endonuclease subunit S [Rubrobacter sp.]MCA3763267.1 restriction endonuclease subunit S [Cutibacterium sp.]
MAGEWSATTWGELATLEYGRALRQYQDGPGPFRVFGTNGPIGWHHEALCPHPSVVIGRKGAYRGVHYSPDPFFAIDTAFYLKPKAEFDMRWAYYQLLTQDINGMDSGSAIPSTSREAFYALPVEVPPLDEQRAIARILGTLDDKIELNRRMNETLEEMARAIFKSWFVDFEPVRAKMEGRWRRGQSLPGLPAHLYDLFPDRFVDSELGEIPEGWEVGTLGNHFEAVKGVSYKGSGLSDNGVPLHNLNSIHEGGGYKYEGIKFYRGEYAERHVVEPGDVIVANTEQGHDRLLIGYAAIVPRLFGKRGIASHHIYRLRPKPSSPLTASFVYRLLNSPRMHDVVSGYANGTTVNMLPLDGVQKPQIVVPPRDLVIAFSTLAAEIEARCEETVVESRTLAAIRDTLLPKLISGELRVKDAERIVVG